MNAVIDTNILIDHIHGVEDAIQELARYEKLVISRIVWIEFLSGAKAADVEARRRSLLEGFELVEVDAPIAEEAVLLRRRLRLKTPDAIILATARVHGMLLVTRNDRDFSLDDPDIRIPY
jgi:hypothetical protein